MRCYSIFFCFLALYVQKQVASPHEEYEKIGNLTLSPSQQPNPLFALGQNIVDKGDIQAFSFINHFVGKKKLLNQVIPSFLYGIQDNLSVFGFLPLAPQVRQNSACSKGIQDLGIQFEYAYYTKSYKTYVNQATIVGALFLPTGSAKKNPPTGYGATSFLWGTTASYNAIDWYAFLSGGGIFTTSHHGTKFGNSFFYQGGLGRNLFYITETMILTALVEVFGNYHQRDRRAGVVDINSGSHAIYIAPSLWFATQKLIIQGGIAIPVMQELKGNQPKDRYLGSLYIGWKFN